MIVFKNPGVIDPRSIVTFGVSSKENSSAIGFFGTGLKYAIAILLRHDCAVTIYAGGRKLVFGTKVDKIRKDEFQTVTMNNRRLAFTTELGKTWEPWQALRELWCNTLDELGEVFETDLHETQYSQEVGQTVICVSGRAIEEAWAERGSVILQSSPFFLTGGCEVHHSESPSEYVFYRGIRAGKLEKPSNFIYNIKESMQLTEDRTLKYPWMVMGVIRRCLSQNEDSGLIRRILTASEDHLEGTLNWKGVSYVSDPFLDTAVELLKTRTEHLNKTVFDMAKEHRNTTASGLYESIKLNKVEAEQLRRAVRFNKSLGAEISKYPVVPVQFLGKGILGMALVADKTILVAHSVFGMGTKMLAGTIYEEFCHLEYGYHDETREFQNFLIDKVMSMGELLNGNPL